MIRVYSLSFLLGLGLTANLLLTSCQTSQHKSVAAEVSLKSDRSQLEQYRGQIPDDVKEDNDFMALVLKDMSGLSRTPQEVVDRFYKEVRRTREKFAKNQKDKREDFNNSEKDKREAFLQKLKSDRDTFKISKPRSDESNHFFSEQNLKRNRYFQDQSDRRRSFESLMDQARRDFNADMQDKQKQFDDAYREYSKNYQQKEKEKKAIERAKQDLANQSRDASALALPPPGYPGQDRDLEEFNSLPTKNRKQLGDDN